MAGTATIGLNMLFSPAEITAHVEKVKERLRMFLPFEGEQPLFLYMEMPQLYIYNGFSVQMLQKSDGFRWYLTVWDAIRHFTQLKTGGTHWDNITCYSLDLDIDPATSTAIAQMLTQKDHFGLVPFRGIVLDGITCALHLPYPPPPPPLVWQVEASLNEPLLQFMQLLRPIHQQYILPHLIAKTR